MSNRNQNAWLFGAVPDLMLGGGLLYILVASGLVVWGSAARDIIPNSWIAYLVLIVSGSHYGGTLLRVYEHPAERRIYRVFTVYGTLVMLAVLVGALYSPIVGSLLITLYLTWSPWHYTGQNYGISVMFLRRRGVEITPLTKRLLHTSFVSSFLLVLLTMHFEGSGGQVDPFGYESLDSNEFQFIGAGIPNALRSILMPAVGLVYVSTVTAALIALARSGGARAIAPTALLMLTQGVWFSIPYLGSYLELATNIPALNAIDPTSYRFYFIWVALGHAAQYLWITAYYARSDPRWGGYGSYFTKVFVFGNAVWAAPIVLLGPDALGRPDFDFGLAMCVAATVNLHHFVLDGAIWKLRNPRLAAVLLRGQSGDTDEPSTSRPARWKTRVAWTLAGVFCLTRILPYVELNHRFPSALERNDYAAAESILDRAAFYGRDSAVLRLRLAQELAQSRIPKKSIPQYWRSLKLHPDAQGFAALGVLSQRVLGPAEAIYAWKKGIDHFPGNFALNWNLGTILLTGRQPQKALPYLERAVAVQPDNEQAIKALSIARKQSNP